VIAAATREIGRPAWLELRHDLMADRTCTVCGHADRPLRPLARLGQGAALCASCGAQTRWSSISRISADDELASSTLRELGVPEYDLIRCRAGLETYDALLEGDRPALEA
jgi:hypothetical protein